MSFFPVHIFPQGSLAESVITTVWVGVFVVSFFTLRLGWPFSGLVVPGYLIPILIAKPVSAAIIFAEGVLTYCIVSRLSERRSDAGMWSSFFGRDRFFALVITSLAVRIVLDGWLLPALGDFLAGQFHLAFDYRNNLSSFGLIIVALVANQFWKTGLKRGMAPFLVTNGLTYFAVRYLLIELTNFNIGNLEYMYENIASSLLASPKSYIMLLSTSFVASRMNLLYGWDFNGILIPSLLALQWYQPGKILVSFLEAGIIFVVSSAILKTRWCKDITVEGARKVLLFFNVSFAYKMALSYGAAWIDPSFRVTDIYGFGYLLPTLMAVKMHDKKIPLRLTRATLQVSFAGACAATLLGFSLTFIPELWSWGLPARAEQVREAGAAESESLIQLLRYDKLALYQKRTGGTVTLPLPQEVDLFVKGIRGLQRYVKGKDEAELDGARAHLERIGYAVEEIHGRYLCLREGGERKGWGTYVFNLAPRSPLVVEVPAPIDEWATLEAGSCLFEYLGGAALAVGGSSRKIRRDGVGDVLTGGLGMYQAFHRTLGRRNVLQVRGYSSTRLLRLSPSAGEETDGQPRSALWVSRGLPEGADLARLRALIGPYEIEWQETPFANLQRDETWSGFGELVLARSDRKKLMALAVIGPERSRSSSALQRLDGHLVDRVKESKRRIAGKATNLYVRPRIEELYFFDEEVLAPLLQLIRENRQRHESGRADRAGRLSEEELREASLIAAAASTLDYSLKWLVAPAGEEHLILEEDERAPRRRSWGSYIFRLGAAASCVIQVPRPLHELNSFEFGLELYGRLRPMALMIAGSHPRANADGSADVIDHRNKVNLFSLVNQVISRHTAGEELLVVQCRAFGLREPESMPAEDIIAAFSSGAAEREHLQPPGAALCRRLEGAGFSLRLADGDRVTAGYDACGIAQAQYLSLSDRHELCVLWLSPFLRSDYSERGEALERARCDALGIESLRMDLLEALRAPRHRRSSGALPAALEPDLARYVATRDVLALARIQRLHGLVEVRRLADAASGSAFLLLYVATDGYPVVVRLQRWRGSGATIDARELGREELDRFTGSNAAWLEITALEDG
jgi:hypothetical protein